MCYGPPGVGKTSMAAHIPGVVFLTDSQEDGITTLKANGLVPKDVHQFPPMTCWEHTLEVLTQLETGEHNHKALAIDAIGGFERMCHEAVCQREFDGNWGEKGFAGFQRGMDVSTADIRLLINALDRLRDKRGMGIFILGHSKVEQFKNPDGSDYSKYSVDIHKKTWGLLHKWCDVVMFANFYTEVVNADKNGKGGKGRGGQQRYLYCENSAAFDAKNRSGLTGEISMGDSGAEAFKNFSAAMKAARKIYPVADDAAQKGETE